MEGSLINHDNIKQYYDNCNDITCKIKVLKDYLEYQHLQTKNLLHQAKKIIETNQEICNAE
jgi:hypothetical protein